MSLHSKVSKIILKVFGYMFLDISWIAVWVQGKVLRSDFIFLIFNSLATVYIKSSESDKYSIF